MPKLNVEATRNALQNFEFTTLFIEHLGWSYPPDTRPVTQTVKDVVFQRRMIAELSGAVILEIATPDGNIPNAAERGVIARAMQDLYFEHVLIFVDQARTRSLWRWMKKQAGKMLPREHVYVKGQPGDLFIAKISALVFDISEFDEQGKVPIVEVAGRLKNALDVERVTKQFFQEYQREYRHLCDQIQGIPHARDRAWYASVLLNRLMFTYFLQKKLFLDHGNARYLSDKLAQVQRAAGRDQFYRAFLQTLFFEGFGKSKAERSPETQRLIGDIVYLNGGLFLPHHIEDRYPEIAIPDDVFERLFRVFDAYSWSLNDTPGGNDNEINPDVLGYIFEKYINQKEFGAYYTRPEITEYLCEQTIFKLVLDEINRLAAGEQLYAQYQPHPRPLPNRGGEFPLAFGEGAGGEVCFSSMPDLLMNLDATRCKQLLDFLPGLSLLDPACGSGAFLVAAMKTLIDIYSAVVGKIEFLSDPALTAHLKKLRAGHQSVQYFIKKRIITDNLYGVDIMEEAVEITKLRLFLALVASAQSVADLEPLPNIDFNILAGNSLIGLMRVDETKFAQAANLFRKSYREILNEKAAAIRSYKEQHVFGDQLKLIRDSIDEKRQEAIDALNDMLLDEFNSLKIKYEQTSPPSPLQRRGETPSPLGRDGVGLKGKPVKRALRKDDIAALHPFHWAFEFSEIFGKKNGFDAIITNPPWEIFKPQAKEFFAEYSDLVTKNKMDIKTFEKEQAKLLRDPEIAAAWCEYQSRYPHVSAYFRSAAQFQNQIAIVNGKKAGTDINLYKLFLEQCFNLLRPGGTCGIVIPSGIYTDLGAKQLRQMLFDHTTITGLFGFENRKNIFENVDSRFKFVVLTFEKAGRTEQFPAAFMRHDVAELAHFPDERSVLMSVELIRKLSPDSLSIMEFKDDIDIRIAEKMSKFPMLGQWIEGEPLEFSREFMSSDDHHRFNETGNGLIVYEGKMFDQFNHRFEPPRWWISIEELKKTHFYERGDWKYHRFGIRRIAASTNERTLIATMLPRNSVVVHSVFVNVKNILPPLEALSLIAFFNSFVADFSLRKQVTSNISQFFIYQLPVPRLTAGDAWFEAIVTRAARLICTTPEFADLWKAVMGKPHPQPLPKGEGSSPSPLERGGGGEVWTPDCGVTDEAERNKLRAELDAIIAHIYGLTADELAYILTTFPLVPQAQKDAVLAEFAALRRI